MYCKNCGKEIDDRAVICPYCGVAVNEEKLKQMNGAAKSDDAPSVGFAVLCFFLPILGLILYLVWKDEYPLKAKSCGKGALIGVITEVVGTIFLILLWTILFFVGIFAFSF